MYIYLEYTHYNISVQRALSRLELAMRRKQDELLARQNLAKTQPNIDSAAQTGPSMTGSLTDQLRRNQEAQTGPSMTGSLTDQLRRNQEAHTGPSMTGALTNQLQRNQDELILRQQQEADARNNIVKQNGPAQMSDHQNLQHTKGGPAQMSDQQNHHHAKGWCLTDPLIRIHPVLNQELIYK